MNTAVFMRLLHNVQAEAKHTSYSTQGQEVSGKA